MSIGLVLETTRDSLRTKFKWGINQCGISLNALPLATSIGFFIALDDGQVAAGAIETQSLREDFNIEIGIWRTLTDVPQDRTGQVYLTEDLYRAQLDTLENLERKVATHLHDNEDIRNAANATLTDPTCGFTTPWRYRGRQRTETTVLSLQGGADRMYIGRRLQFFGFRREQDIKGTLE